MLCFVSQQFTGSTLLLNNSRFLVRSIGTFQFYSQGLEGKARVLSLSHIFGPHLIQGGLGHRVVLYGQPLLMPGELAENVGQRSWRVRELILQCVVMLLLQDAAWECLLDEILDCLQHKGRAADPDNQRVAITKSERRQEDT